VFAKNTEPAVLEVNFVLLEIRVNLLSAFVKEGVSFGNLIGHSNCYVFRNSDCRLIFPLYTFLAESCV
jgi:hypothetical protein